MLSGSPAASPCSRAPCPARSCLRAAKDGRAAGPVLAASDARFFTAASGATLWTSSVRTAEDAGTPYRLLLP